MSLVIDQPGVRVDGSKVSVGETVRVVPSRELPASVSAGIVGLAGPVVQLHRGTLDIVVDLPEVGRRTLRQRQVEVVAAPAPPDPHDRAREAVLDLSWQIAMRWNPLGEGDRAAMKETLAALREALDQLAPPRALDTPPRPRRPAGPDAPTRRIRRPVIEALGCE